MVGIESHGLKVQMTMRTLKMYSAECGYSASYLHCVNSLEDD